MCFSFWNNKVQREKYQFCIIWWKLNTVFPQSVMPVVGFICCNLGIQSQLSNLVTPFSFIANEEQKAPSESNLSHLKSLRWVWCISLVLTVSLVSLKTPLLRWDRDETLDSWNVQVSKKIWLRLILQLLR